MFVISYKLMWNVTLVDYRVGMTQAGVTSVIYEFNYKVFLMRAILVSKS